MKLRQEIKGNVYFSSDWHLSHTNIAGPKVSNWEKGYRIFESVHEMNRTIIEAVNNKVGQEDTLFYLGDFYFGDKSKMKNIRNMIYCQNIIFIMGNHDKENEINKIFPSVYDICEFNSIKFANTHYFLSHYAHRIWPRSHHGSVHLYAHSHNSLEFETWGKSMDIGIDSAYSLFGEFRPFAEEEVIKIINQREIKKLDHHV